MKPSNYDKLKLKVDDVAVIQGRDKLLCYCYTDSIQKNDIHDIEPTHFLREVTKDELFESINDAYYYDNFETLFYRADIDLHRHMETLLNLQESRTETIPLYEDFDLEKEIDLLVKDYTAPKDANDMEVIYKGGGKAALYDLKTAMINHRNKQHANEIKSKLNP